LAVNPLPLHNVLAIIDDYPLADGTLAGGFALGDIRVDVQRISDVVIPINAIPPVVFDRDIRKTVFDFQITRIHASFEAADKYVADHDAAIPSSGAVQFTATDGTVRYLIDAELITHSRIGGIGKTTTHSYHIVGGRIHTSPAYYRLLEDGGYRLLESGGKRKLQH